MPDVLWWHLMYSDGIVLWKTWVGNYLSCWPHLRVRSWFGCTYVCMYCDLLSLFVVFPKPTKLDADRDITHCTWNLLRLRHMVFFPTETFWLAINFSHTKSLAISTNGGFIDADGCLQQRNVPKHRTRTPGTRTKRSWRERCRIEFQVCIAW